MRAGLVVAVCGLVGLAGCSGGVVGGLDGTHKEPGVAGAKLTGAVHGGQNPISGARVYLFAAASGAGGAGQAAYGGSGIAASASNASVSLLTSHMNTLITPVGDPLSGDYYVATGSDGSFSISGDYTCTAGQQVYLYALGGDPGMGTGANAAAGLMAALGSCPTLGTFPSGMYVIVNEVSTVAAAYAMAGFATDAAHVGSSGTALALTGIGNAFANAANLADLPTGTALATTPAGNGTVPQAEINTLANILAACVNSNGAGSACTTLFANAESGGTTGTVATDTATAAIDIAHNPGTNVAALYGLASGMPQFAPVLSGQPNDWTVGLMFTGGGLKQPWGIAMDGAGDAWVPDEAAGSVSVTELSSSGAFVSGASGYSDASLNRPSLVAIDTSGNAWITGGSMRCVAEMSSTGSLLSGPSGYWGDNTFGVNSLVGASGIAIDGSGNVWVPNSAGNDGVSEFASSGSFDGWINGASYGMNVPGGAAASPAGNVWIPNIMNNGISEFSAATGSGNGAGGTSYPGGGLNEPMNVAIDASWNAWVANSGSNSVVKLSSGGTVLSGASGYTGGGLNGPGSIAIDGAGNAWVGDGATNCLTELSTSGVGVSGSSGYACSSAANSFFGALAIDGSGDVWGTVPVYNTVTELIGAAVPVVTPLSAGVRDNKLGTRP